MRSMILPLALLMSASPLFAQIGPGAPVQPVPTRSAVPVQRSDIPVNNPTTMQLRVEIQQLEAKVDELTSLIEAQGTLLASMNSNLGSVQAALEDFRSSVDKQYIKLRNTGFLGCYETAAHPPWGYGDGQVAVNHCTGETLPQGVAVLY